MTEGEQFNILEGDNEGSLSNINQMQSSFDQDLPSLDQILTSLESELMIDSLRKCTTTKTTGQSEVIMAAKRLKSMTDKPGFIEAFIVLVKRDCPDLVEKVPDFAKALDALVHIPLDRFSNPKEVLTFTNALIESGIASQVERGLVFVLGNTNVGKTSLVNTFKNFVESPADEPASLLTEEGDNLIETQVLEVYDGLSLMQRKMFEVKTSGNSPVLVKLEESMKSAFDTRSQGLQLRIVDLGNKAKIWPFYLHPKFSLCICFVELFIVIMFRRPSRVLRRQHLIYGE